MISAETLASDAACLCCGGEVTLESSPSIGEIGSQWNGMESWQERRLKLVSNLAPVMITGALEFVHMYVGRYMSYIFYTDILFQYLKGIKKIMNLKKYIFICLSAS